MTQSLLTIAAAGIGVIVVAVLIRKRLPRSRLLGRMMLEPPAGEEAQEIRRREALVDFHELLGTQGTTTTQLTPGGKARFGDLLVDVIADGEVIGRGADHRGGRRARQPRVGEGSGEWIVKSREDAPRLRSRGQ